MGTVDEGERPNLEREHIIPQGLFALERTGICTRPWKLPRAQSKLCIHFAAAV